MTVFIVDGKRVLEGDLHYKMALVVRKDLDMGRGKLASQTAHAAIYADRRTDQETKDKWLASGDRLLVFKVQSLGELLDLHRQAVAAGLVCSVQTDAGLTDVPADTVTCIAIGPSLPERIDAITGHLKLLG